MTPTREEFFTLTGFEKGLFYVLVFASLGFAAWTIWQRAKLWRQGKPIWWESGWRVWLRNVWSGVLLQRKVRGSRKKSGAPMHLLIFYGFLSLVLATTLLGINTYSPWKFHKGTYYLVYELVFDLLGLLLVVGLVWALVRRAGSRPVARTSRPSAIDRGSDVPFKFGGFHDLDGTSKPRGEQRILPIARGAEDAWALWLLLVITITGYLVEAARIAQVQSFVAIYKGAGGTHYAEQSQWDRWSVIGNSISPIFGALPEGSYRFIWWFHMVWVLVFFATFPRMRLRHIAMAIFSTAGKPDFPMGRLEPITMEEVERTEKIGVSVPADYSRWHLMSLDACMECGRCTEVCPAWNVGKVLNPKKVVQDIRSALSPARAGEGSKVEGRGSGNTIDPPPSSLVLTVAESVSEEALWACTTCNACVEACPVQIRHVDLIVDARRNLVAEGKLTGTPAVMLRQTASTGHAWGAPRNERETWMKDLDIPLCRDGVEFEFLFWVGCAGATDPGAVKTTKAVAQLLKKAGVSFACLGQEEACTGDPARRTGDEFLFQEKAMENLSAFERYGVKKVVTACPHCFNTLLNEYGELDGVLAGTNHPAATDRSKIENRKSKMEVFHHTQLLARLVSEGKLKAADGAGTVIHDPCYLGRVNNEADAPRAMFGETTNYNEQSPDGLGALIRPKTLVEPQFYARKTRCCGAGGGRMWMEEAPDQRPGNKRAEELLATGAKTVALGCPFCRIMLDASVKQVTDEEIRLVDLAEMLQEANA